MLTKLKHIEIGFESSNSHPDPRNGPPTSFTRVVLPALTRLEFHGASEYFEDLVARIDTPAIITAKTSYHDQDDFVIPHFLQFISRTQIPGSLEGVELNFVGKSIYIHVGHRDPPVGKEFRIAQCIMMSHHASNSQNAHLARICSKILPLLSNVERLLIATRPPGYESQTMDVAFPDWKDHMDNPQWLELFHAISASQYTPVAPRQCGIFASTLLELTRERVMDMLPMLHVAKFKKDIIIYYNDTVETLLTHSPDNPYSL